MMPKNFEEQLAEDLREAVLSRVKANRITVEQLSKNADVFPFVMEQCLERSSWSVSTGVAMAKAARLDIQTFACFVRGKHYD